MIKKHIKSKNVIIFIVLLALIIPSIVPIIRHISNRPIIVGEQAYYDIRIAKTILDKGLYFEDNMVIDGREYAAKPYHIVLMPFLYFLTPEFSLIIISFITSLLSVILFYLILKKLKINLQQRFFIFVVLLLSPAFIFTFGTANEFCISIMLLLLGTYFFLKFDKSFVFSLIVFLIAVFFNILNVIVIMFLLLFLSEIKPIKKRTANLIMAFVLILTLLYYTPQHFSNDIFSKVSIIGKSRFSDFISDLGGMMGLSIFTLILGVIGIIITWKYKQKLKNSYLLMLVLFFIGSYLDYAPIYLNFIFSIFAGIAFAYIVNLKWEIKLLKNLTLLLLIYGLLFSAISYINRVSLSEPNKDVQNALEWLKYNSKSNEVVFSHYSKGFWIEYWADRPVVIDGIFNYNEAKQRLEDSNKLLYSRNIDIDQRLMDKYNVRYIFVDDIMKKGQVWDKKEGLWYAFRNNKTFKSIYDKNNVEIWEYIG